MRLRLKYPPVPANAEIFASEIVALANEVDGVILDYSVNSLAKVDDIIEGFRKDGCTAKQIAETLFGFGCYVGEVFVRHVGAKWCVASETSLTEELGGAPLVLQLDSDRFCNPIGKVFKRLTNGIEDNLSCFFTVFGSPSVQPDEQS